MCSQKEPVGTGPWRLAKFIAGTSAELEANKDYWGTKPVWDKLDAPSVPEESTRIAMLKRGEADIAGVSNDNAIKLRDADGFQLAASADMPPFPAYSCLVTG